MLYHTLYQSRTFPNYDIISSVAHKRSPPFPTGSLGVPVFLSDCYRFDWFIYSIIKAFFLNDSLNTLIKACWHLCAHTRVHRGTHSATWWVHESLRWAEARTVTHWLSNWQTRSPPTTRPLPTQTHTYAAINLSGSHTCIQKDFIS